MEGCSYLYNRGYIIINPRRACAARVTVVGLCPFVCLSVDDYSRTTGYEAAHERYQQLQCYKGMKKKCGDFAETTAFERYGVKTSEKANMHNQAYRDSHRRYCSDH